MLKHKRALNRRPRFNGPTEPKSPPPSPPYDPPPGSNFDNGTWTDANGNVLGYSPGEDAPLVPGSANWWQDLNPERNYYDMQNFNSASTSGAFNRHAQDSIRNALAARQSRDYNSGQRGIPVPSVYDPNTLAQRERNMDFQMKTNSLAHNMDWWHNRTPLSDIRTRNNNISSPVLKSFSGGNVRKQALSKLKANGSVPQR